jgi:hypothetical protein
LRAASLFSGGVGADEQEPEALGGAESCPEGERDERDEREWDEAPMALHAMGGAIGRLLR